MSNDPSVTLTPDRPHLSSESAAAAADLPLPELFKRFTGDVTTLIGSEMALARAEIANRAGAAGQIAGLFGAATLLGLGAFFALTLGIVAALACAMPAWAAALIVAVAYGAGAAVAAMRGKAGLANVTEPLPRIGEHVRADVETLKAGFGRGR